MDERELDTLPSREHDPEAEHSHARDVDDSEDDDDDLQLMQQDMMYGAAAGRQHWYQRYPRGTNILVILSVFVLCVVVLSMATNQRGHGTGDAGGSNRPPPLPKRLPRSILPRHYNLDITVDLAAFRFSGTVDITVNVHKDGLDHVLLHAADLDVQAVAWRAGGSTSATKLLYQREYSLQGFLMIEIPKEMRKSGTAVIHLAYRGALNGRLHGFYHSEYTRRDDDTVHRLAVTQFEPTDARLAFPCFDEPDFKATFDIALTVPRDMIALSNSEETSRQDVGTDLRRFQFDRTPAMSTYLVAFFVGDFEAATYTSATSSRPVRVWTRPGYHDEALYAAEMGARILEHYEGYFGIDFPLPKLDMVAVPDFAAGAMENWGLITYRETALLADPASSSARHLQRVVTVIAHELAHQWFGNFVTIQWWSDLWLNEGFATYMEYLGVAAVYPDWQMWDQFIYLDQQRALLGDALASTHPVHVEVGDPGEINEVFDYISYSKGGSLLYMLEKAITAQAFRDSLQKYLTAHRLGNAQNKDLWQAITDHLTSIGRPFDVASHMTRWTNDPGFPIVEVSDSGRVSQRLFQSTVRGAGPATKWWLPLLVRTDKHAAVRVDITSSQHQLDAGIVDGARWILAHAGQSGYFRVQYSRSNWLALANAMAAGEIASPAERAGLVSDVFALSLSMKLGTVDTLALEVAQHMANETDYTVWLAMLEHLGHMHSLLSSTSCAKALESFTLDLMQNVLNVTGWQDPADMPAEQRHVAELRRELILTAAVSWGDAATRAQAAARFHAATAPDQIPDNLRAAVYNAYALTGGHDAFLELTKRFFLEDDTAERLLLGHAMAHTPSHSDLTQMLDLVISDHVRAQDRVSLIIAVSRNVHGQHLVWDFLRDHWPQLLSENQGFGIQNLIRYTLANFASLRRYQEVRDFFLKHSVPGGERTVEQALEVIRINHDWLSSHRGHVCDWLIGGHGKPA